MSRSEAPPPPRAVLVALNFPPGFGGGGLQLSRLMQALCARGTCVQVLTALPPASDAQRRERAFGGRVERLQVSGHPLLRTHHFGARAAAWLLLHGDWDVLHLNGFFRFQFLPMVVARLRRRPVLIKVTELPPDGSFLSARRAGRWMQSLLVCADRFVAITEAIVQALQRAGVPRDRIARIPNGVDTERFRPARGEERRAARERLGIPPELPLILSCGVLTRRKNAIALVRALARLGERPLCLALAGPPGDDAAYLAELDREIADLPDSVRVLRLGSLEPDRIPGLMQAADLFVLISTWEGLPNVLLEAMASALPCVASDIPGCADLLQPDRGLLVGPEDVEGLAAALERLLSDPGLRAGLGAAAQRYVESHYSFAAVAERYRALYDEILERGQPASVGACADAHRRPPSGVRSSKAE